MQDKIDILLATYNGEEYVAEQIESILAQTHTNFRVIIGDDASRDTTPETLAQYIKKFPDKFIFQQQCENIGTIQNFSKLAKLVEADYIMLSDQDDIWLPHKIEKTLAKMKALEQIHGSDTPLLIHTDLSVVDENLQLIHPSYWKYGDHRPENSSLARVLSHNNVMGCSSMINRALLKRAFPIPAQAYMHDHWLNLVATAFGHVEWIPDKTVYYRQHRKNWIGSKRSIKTKEIYSLLFDKKKFERATATQKAKLVQAQYFYNKYHQQLTDDSRKLIESFISLKKQTFLKEVKMRFRYNFHPGGFWRSTHELVTSFMDKRKPLDTIQK